MEKKNLYIGIDNGKKGGIAGVDEDENIIFCEIMPMIILKKTSYYDILAMVGIFKLYGTEYNLKVVLEKAHTMPMSSAKSNFVTGQQYGCIETILKIYNISYEIVYSKHWQKAIFQGMTVRDTKDTSIEFCMKKYPSVDFRASERCRKNHDGKTDALCMAVYCRRK